MEIENNQKLSKPVNLPDVALETPTHKTQSLKDLTLDWYERN
jgi:hypothetical protein